MCPVSQSGHVTAFGVPTLVRSAANNSRPNTSRSALISAYTPVAPDVAPLSHLSRSSQGIPRQTSRDRPPPGHPGSYVRIAERLHSGIAFARTFVVAATLASLAACSSQAIRVAQPRELKTIDAPTQDFTGKDQRGKPVALSAALSRGVTVLVFYRGHW